MFWLWFSLGAAVIVLLPYLRMLCKRVILYFKVMDTAENVGGRVVPAHAFWLFGRRTGKTCDFYIETPEKIYAVKLFTVLFKTTTIFFTDQGSYTLVYNVAMFGRWNVFSQPIPAKTRQLPDYDFTSGLPSDTVQKEFYPALLIHPSCFEIYRQIEVRSTELLYAGDMIRGLHVQSLSGLLKEIRRGGGPT